MLIEELAADTVAYLRSHNGRWDSRYEWGTEADRHEGQEQGNEGKESLPSAGAHGQNTLTNLEQVYERRATGKAITGTEEAVCNHSQSDLQLLIS